MADLQDLSMPKAHGCQVVAPSPKKDAKYYKHRILRYLASWGTNNYIGGVHEAPNLWSADVVGIKYSGKVSEFEIKTSRPDLLGEIKAIRRALEPESVTSTRQNSFGFDMGFEMYRVAETKLSSTKIEKHHHYLTSPRSGSFRPNSFYFAVPSHLVDVAIENTQGLKYGVFDADALTIVKKARSLHAEPHDNTTYIHMLNRLSVMYRDLENEKPGLRFDVLYKVAEQYNLEFGSVGYMKLMEVMKNYE